MVLKLRWHLYRLLRMVHIRALPALRTWRI
jgi:hypothetical protein